MKFYPTQYFVREIKCHESTHFNVIELKYKNTIKDCSKKNIVC